MSETYDQRIIALLELMLVQLEAINTNTAS